MSCVLYTTWNQKNTNINNCNKNKARSLLYLIYVLTEMSQSQLSVVGEGMARNSGVLSDQE